MMHFNFPEERSSADVTRVLAELWIINERIFQAFIRKSIKLHETIYAVIHGIQRFATLLNDHLSQCDFLCDSRWFKHRDHVGQLTVYHL